MARAVLLVEDRQVQGDLTLEMVVWQLPQRTSDRPHGLKYRFCLVRRGVNLVRYDNETGKGDHKHHGPEETEQAYVFSTLDNLISDFRLDCERFGWRSDE
jgi:hypothetical protein